jgi:hypothetical protein
MNDSGLSRRDWLVHSCALVSAASLGLREVDRRTDRREELVRNSRGGYRFLPGLPFLSLGAVASDGFEIGRTTFRQPRPLTDALREIERRLEGAGRPIHALCGLELRSPRVPTPPEFVAMNQAYMARLGQMGLLIDGSVPLARTNVASSVQELSVHAYSYTLPVTGTVPVPPSFVTSAMPEVRNLRRAGIGAEPPDFVAVGDTTAAGALTVEGLRKKTEFILTAVNDTLGTLGVGWAQATGVQLYTLENAHPLLESLILPRIGAAAHLGLQWHHTHPPGMINLIEIDVRGIRVETMA